ncbi:porin [Pseudomonas putida]|jgi:hypothetical protein|uniref:porin n=1 Tax=Pseudomonas TaxID=286 RepID=UPI000C1006C7|nr:MULTISPECIES: porin [unclassified Pseudomonas]MBL1308502.1 hypothetical protein [Pseudomonas sp.]NUU36641.1 hypothetical protein [Pseudomonas sp. C2B4]
MYLCAKRKLIGLALLPTLMLMNSPSYAVAVTDNLDIGGAIRARGDFDPDENISELSFDTLILTTTYTSERWIGAAKYRFYGGDYPFRGSTGKVGDISFPEYAWVGYKFDDAHQIQVGLNQIPFGLQHYFGSIFFETLGNVIGLEDVQDLGIKYIQQSGDWNLQAGYYISPADQGKGTSRGGRTWSPSVAAADVYVVDGSNNKERDIVAGRLVRNFKLGNWQSEIGGSIFTSSLENRDTNDNGRRNAVAVHYKGKNGPWGVQLQAARQEVNPQNPGTDKVVTFGALDGTFNVASKGDLYVADLSYDIAEKLGWSTNIKVYGNYSLFDKDEDAFKDSQRFILGTSFSVGSTFIAVEWLNGKNDPYVGASSYTQSAGAGGTNQWENQLYTNIGYYF